MPEASRDRSLGTFARNMKPSLIATIFFGLLLSLNGAEPEWSDSVNGIRGWPDPKSGTDQN